MMFGIDSLYIWLAVIIISVAVEAFTLTLCGIWFAAGGVAALIAASLSVGLYGAVDCVHRVLRAATDTGASALPPFLSAAGSRRPTQIVSSDRLPLLPNRLTMFWRPVR